ncbi:hypothetical protein HG535_0E00390 [Zygotorulaspora mrakii]|uniref:Cytidyltransferase-like domain-containing protein n=1 Tax=Zygotorulaspora mrakii TaxID=42260 RepID=A0A7H9B2R5_ZYGMR|nr:uncharacterized protein HG535_0E00390 [Zygotorulaspora mrakii]QLG72955.1 hypothetical protein HG535_0E00390 [Zygotorulaspora mrakii]
MVVAAIAFQEIESLNFEGLHNLFCELFQNLKFDASSELHIILLDTFDSSIWLDRVLGRFYSISRDVLLAKNLHTMSITILFGEYAKDNLRLDYLFIPAKELVQEFDALNYDIFNQPRRERELNLFPEKRNDCDEYAVSALGGTFDHIHDGHKILLSIASFITSTRIIVGVTHQDLLLKKKYKEYLESFEKRCGSVRQFLNLLKPSLKVEIVPIKDVCGPTGTVPEIECLVVSRETVAGGDFVNKTRVEKGLPKLDICVVNVLGGDEEDGWKEKLSSTEIRKMLMHGI